MDMGMISNEFGHGLQAEKQLFNVLDVIFHL